MIEKGFTGDVLIMDEKEDLVTIKCDGKERKGMSCMALSQLNKIFEDKK